MRAWMLALATLGLSCTPGLDCQQRPVNRSGDLSRDVLGAWAGFGVDSPVYISFHADGGTTTVEAPNMYAPSGNSSSGTWALTDGGVVLNGQTYSAEVTDGGLALTQAGFTRTHPAVTCTGHDLQP